MAAFIRGDADAPAATSEKLLERLTLPTAAAPLPTAANAPAPVNEQAEAKLSQLTRSEPAAPPQPVKGPAGTPAPAENLEKANEKLSSLLGGKGK